jgi:tRNA 2-thiouridine synthesizing protein A
MPILRIKQAIDALDVGQVLQMIATDTASPADVKEWTDMTGHELLESEESGSKFIFLIRKA